ncbi:MAG: hypothetical protein KatS3mg053_1444 [Candidatus Roseilinea sp.]|nr:MAG: hypothetical protein KatS3mg053_1444 [Candidatus Roseilinea sp.]
MHPIRPKQLKIWPVENLAELRQNTPKQPRLLDQLRDATHRLHYAYSTEKSYLQWVTRFILLHHKRHPNYMGRAEVEAFPSHLAIHVSAFTQNQALSAGARVRQNEAAYPSLPAGNGQAISAWPAKHNVLRSVQ